MLRIENLSKTYPNGIQALREVTLEIPEGMFGLLGPNGAGKSTLMRTIACLQTPDDGTIVFDEVDVLEEHQRLRRSLGYLPQDFGVYPRVSVETLLAHFAILKGIDGRRQRREAVERLLRMTNLYEVRKQKLGTLSGGMRQRFGIAQALLGEPRLIIVDEPTAGLDPEERQRFLNLLNEIGENVVVILSTHIVADVSELCRRMAILCDGRVVLCAEPAQAIAELDGKVWRKAVDRQEIEGCRSSMPLLSTRLIAGRTVIHVYGDQSPGDGFEPVTPDLQDVYFSTLRAAEPSAAGGQ